jgi:hypothetical protein
MDKVERVVCNGNILCFSGQLRWETTPARQEKLKRLLIEEENRVGATEERLGIAEHKLREGAELIVRQRCLIEELKRRNEDAAGAERTLQIFETIQALFERFHEQLMTRGKLSANRRHTAYEEAIG